MRNDEGVKKYDLKLIFFDFHGTLIAVLMMELILNEDVANDPIIEPKDRILFRHATKCRKVRRKKKKQAADAAAILNIFSEPSDVERLQYLEEELDMTVLNRITTTLGYIPLNLMSVPARNEDGNPVVLKLYPLNSYENNFFEKKYSKNDKDMNFMRGETLFPFPTIFWLYCPQVDARISALEKTGWIQALTDRLQSSSEYLTDMEYAHRAYADERWSLLHPDHITYLESRGW